MNFDYGVSTKKVVLFVQKHLTSNNLNKVKFPELKALKI